jgi:hypothetical protein
MISIGLQTIILSVVIAGFPADVRSCRKARQSAPAESQNGKTKAHTISPEDVLRVNEAAQRFITRFRETLDFGLVFDEMSASNAVGRMRKAKFFESMNLGAKLLDSVDDAALRGAYKAVMNVYYLQAAYNLSIRSLAGNEHKGDPPLPPEITSAMRSSRYLSVLLEEGAKDAPFATTREELEQFVGDFTRVAALYKKHLPPDFFNSETYKANVEAINKEGESVQIRDGYDTMGVRKGTKVYEVDKDIFTFLFVEENGQIKVLTLGLGN